jgi:hypothetical protein
LNDAGYLVGPIVSLILYVIFDAAVCTDADVSVFDFFNEFFTDLMNMSAEKYPAARVIEGLVPGLNASISSLAFLMPAESASKPAKKAELYARLNLRLTYRPAQDLVAVEAAPVACAKGGVGGGT